MQLVLNMHVLTVQSFKCFINSSFQAFQDNANNEALKINQKVGVPIDFIYSSHIITY